MEGGEGPASSEQRERREETTNYELNSKRVATVSNGYSVTRLSIAVVVNEARIKAVLRRQAPLVPGAPGSEDESVSFGEYELSLATRELKKGDEVHMLTTGEFAVLKALVQHAREPLTRDKLMNLARGREWDALERSIDVQISRLRRLIEPDPSKPRYIQTVWGVGYVFVPDGNK